MYFETEMMQKCRAVQLVGAKTAVIGARFGYYGAISPMIPVQKLEWATAMSINKD